MLEPVRLFSLAKDKGSDHGMLQQADCQPSRDHRVHRLHLPRVYRIPEEVRNGSQERGVLRGLAVHLRVRFVNSNERQPEEVGVPSSYLEACRDQSLEPVPKGVRDSTAVATAWAIVSISPSRSDTAASLFDGK